MGKLILEIVVAILVSVLAFLVVYQITNFDRLEYEKCLKEWNTDAEKNKFRPRINNEILVYEIKEPFLMYLDERDDPAGEFDVVGDIGFDTHFNNDYVYAKIIDTTNKRVFSCWAKKSFIRYPKSNWGLTQDVWKLDKRVADIEKQDNQVADNPFPSKKKIKKNKKEVK